jgi:hypothetical protein
MSAQNQPMFMPRTTRRRSVTASVRAAESVPVCLAVGGVNQAFAFLCVCSVSATPLSRAPFISLKTDAVNRDGKQNADYLFPKSAVMKRTTSESGMVSEALPRSSGYSALLSRFQWSGRRSGEGAAYHWLLTGAASCVSVNTPFQLLCSRHGCGHRPQCGCHPWRLVMLSLSEPSYEGLRHCGKPQSYQRHLCAVRRGF